MTFEETLAALPLTPEERATVERAVAFVREHGITCTGCVSTPTCDWPPLKVVVLHGRAMAINCPRCVLENGAMILGMGHGSFREDGVLTQDPKWLRTCSLTIQTDPVRALPRGPHWTAAKEAAWRRAWPTS